MHRGSPGGPGGPGRPPKQSKAGLWIVLILVVVIGGGAGLFLVLGRDGSSSDAGGGNSPAEQAVWDFIKASDAKDCAKIVELVSNESIVGGTGETPDRAAEAQTCQQGLESGEDTETAFPPESEIDKIEATEQSGDSAMVTIAFGSESIEMPMVKQDGQWRLDFYNADAFSGGSSDAGGGGPPAEGANSSGSARPEEPTGSGSASPEEAITSYSEALLSGDCEAAAGLLTDDAVEDFNIDAEEGSSTPPAVAQCAENVEEMPFAYLMELEAVDYTEETTDPSVVVVIWHEPGDDIGSQNSVVLKDSGWKIDQ